MTSIEPGPWARRAALVAVSLASAVVASAVTFAGIGFELVRRR